MKNLLITVIALFTFGVTWAEKTPAPIETKIIGSWKVVGVRTNTDRKLTSKEQKEAKQLKKAVFTFTEDHHAKVKMFLSSSNVHDGYWYYNEKKNVIHVTDWDNHEKDRMRLWYDINDDGSLSFYVDETPLVMDVVKSND